MATDPEPTVTIVMAQADLLAFLLLCHGEECTTMVEGLLAPVPRISLVTCTILNRVSINQSQT